MQFVKIFKPGTSGRRLCALSATRAWFLEIALVCVSVCVCVSAPRPLITSSVIWCDIDRVRLVKQVLRLFPAFNYFTRHFPSIKWMGMAILTQHVMNACQETNLVKRKHSSRVGCTGVSCRLHWG